MNDDNIIRGAFATTPTKREPRWDYLEVAVRGFETEERGDQIVALLEEIGFTVKGDVFDGSSDSLGGLIETYPAKLDDLDPSDQDEIQQRVSALDPTGETFCQWIMLAVVG